MKQLLPLLINWFQHPVIELKMTASDEVSQLRSQLDDANDQIARLKHDQQVLRSKYVMACELNMSYIDLLNQHGIKHRHLR